MKLKGSPLLLFDGDCGICNLAVRYVISIDLEKRFFFASLQSNAARKFLGDKHESLIKANTLVLIEDYPLKVSKIWIRSRAFFRIYWILGGPWKLLGWISFLPGFIGDLFYRLFARSRHRFNVKIQDDSSLKDRFLD